jgi:phosphoribosylaminoimidazole (AIR) synthetase
MWHVFNMGVGFVLVVKPQEAASVMEYCDRHEFGALLIGEVAAVAESRFQWCE